MDNLREKLIAIYNKLEDEGLACTAGKADMADLMIANGVTVQEEAKLYWKPVSPGVWNLTCSACDSHLGCREDSKFCPECGARFVRPKAVAPKLLEEDDC